MVRLLSYFGSCAKIISKQITDLTVRTTGFLEGNTGDNFCNLSLGKDSLGHKMHKPLKK